MIKLLEVKKIGDSRFEVLFLRKDEKISFTVKTIPHEVESLQKKYDLLAVEDNSREFSDIWGQSFELRQEVGKRIRQLKDKTIPELQTA